MDSDIGHRMGVVAEPAASATASIRVQRNGGASIVTLVGDHDVYSAPALRDALQRELVQRRPCVIDLRGTTLVDSSVLAVLVEARRQSRDQDLELPLVLDRSRASAVRRLVKATMVTFRTFDDAAAAAAVARGRSQPPVPA